MNQTGLITCAHYAFPPNSLHYCGPEKQINLAAYREENIADLGLVEILQDFQTLYPYLALIAYENNIQDPFDPRVVEAYWIGNDLLDKVSMNKFYQHLNDSLGLKKRLKHNDLKYLFGKIPHGALPHHVFHVLNVFTRTGHQAVEHTLETMDACRISWGRIVRNPKLLVETQPLVLEKGKLTLGKAILKELIQSPSRSPFGHLEGGLWVSFHWNTFCGVLTNGQATRLKSYTEQAISLANQTL